MTLHWDAAKRKKRPLTPLLTADSIAKTGTDHLLGSLVLKPALADEVRQSCIRPAGSLLGKLGHSGRMVDRRLDVSDHTRASALECNVGFRSAAATITHKNSPSEKSFIKQ